MCHRMPSFVMCLWRLMGKKKKRLERKILFGEAGWDGGQRRNFKYIYSTNNYSEPKC